MSTLLVAIGLIGLIYPPMLLVDGILELAKANLSFPDVIFLDRMG